VPAGGSCQLCLPAALVTYALQNCSAIRFFSSHIKNYSRDTTKLAFLKLGILNVGIMNFGYFETGCFDFRCVGAGQIEIFEFHYWEF
jgi:hypothetical protein